MEYALILSGQGSEKVGMLRDVITKDEAAKQFVKRAGEIVETNLIDIINSRNFKEITDPKVNQIIIYLYHNIFAKLIIHRVGQKPKFIAGHSLGQLCSYSIAGVLSEDEMLSFLKKRTDIITDESVPSKARLLNLFGVTYEQMNALIQENQLADCIAIALHNQESNVVIAATEEGRTSILKLAGKYKFIVLKMEVTGAYHSFFMDEYNKRLLPYIQQLNFKDSEIPILLNNACKLESAGEAIKKETEVQMTSTVYWYDSLKTVECDNYFVIDPSGNQGKLVSKAVIGNISKVTDYSSLKHIRI